MSHSSHPDNSELFHIPNNNLKSEGYNSSRIQLKFTLNKKENKADNIYAQDASAFTYRSAPTGENYIGKILKTKIKQRNYNFLNLKPRIIMNQSKHKNSNQNPISLILKGSNILRSRNEYFKSDENKPDVTIKEKSKSEKVQTYFNGFDQMQKAHYLMKKSAQDDFNNFKIYEEKQNNKSYLLVHPREFYPNFHLNKNKNKKVYKVTAFPIKKNKNLNMKNQKKEVDKKFVSSVNYFIKRNSIKQDELDIYLNSQKLYEDSINFNPHLHQSSVRPLTSKNKNEIFSNRLCTIYQL